MAIPLSNEIKALLDSPNLVHLATLMPDGPPQSVPVWMGRESEEHDDAIRVSRSPSSISTTRIRRPSFGAAWSSAVPTAISHTLDAICLRYTGAPFLFRSPEGRVGLVIEFEKARYTKLPFEHTPPR